MRCAPNYINLHQITFHFIIYYYKMYVFDCIQRGGIACGEVKCGTVRMVFGTRSNSPPPPHLILELFIRCLLVGVREGLGVAISLSYKWKQICVIFRRIVYVYELFSTWNEPDNGIKNQGLYNFFAIIGPSFTVDSCDHSYSGPGLSGWVARSRRVRLSRRLGMLWLIVADHDCIYWLYPYLLLYYTLHPTTKVAIFRPVWTPELASCSTSIQNLGGNVCPTLMHAMLNQRRFALRTLYVWSCYPKSNWHFW
jgi:hypothetical protein